MRQGRRSAPELTVCVGGADAVEEDDKNEQRHDGRALSRANVGGLFQDLEHEASDGRGAQPFAEAGPDQREQAGIDQSGGVDE